ncbi:MAG TPA: indole-3-glycerol-phosphate synthase TrpC, partial [Syntrophorhabdus aromaticivorans]|nr:indole-3-glycerol-phosphate synthase TrpC [Syntrophorhabdus aromaticivorans]
GINNRDITVYETDDDDVARTEDLARFCGQGRPLISESSINTAEEVRRAGRSGADAVLIGTAVLKAEPMSELLGELVSVGWPP